MAKKTGKVAAPKEAREYIIVDGDQYSGILEISEGVNLSTRTEILNEIQDFEDYDLKNCSVFRIVDGTFKHVAIEPKGYTLVD